MQREDYNQFSEMLDGIWMLKGQAVLAGAAKAMFFRALAAYPLIEVRAGLDAHLRDPKGGQFLPMPADVIKHIQGIVADDGRPGAEEAWATAFRSRDESATVVWTDEMSEAYRIAAPLMQAGDEIGARMAFKEAYGRLMTEARMTRRPPSWTASLGFDIEGRRQVLLPHIEAGRLSADLMPGLAIGLDQVLALPAPEGATEKSLAIREEAMAKLRELRDAIVNREPGPSLAELDSERTRSLQRKAADRVAAYQATHPEVGA